MNPTNIPPMITWANEASPEQLQSWLHARLHGKDRRWPEPDDGLSVPHSAISEVIRHPAASDSACIPLVRAACNALREALPAWAGQPEETGPAHCPGCWTAAALSNLLLLIGDLLETPGPRREELRTLLAALAPRLPCRAAGIPLRAKGLTALINLGGQAGSEFWSDLASEQYPELTAIAFSGMARQNLENAIQWLGATQSMDRQYDIARKYRPTLVRLAGGEMHFCQLVHRHLFRSNAAMAKKLRAALAPVGNELVLVKYSELELLTNYSRQFLDPEFLADPAACADGQPELEIPILMYESSQQADVVQLLSQRRLEKMFTTEERGAMSPHRLADALRNIARSITPRRMHFTPF